MIELFESPAYYSCIAAGLFILFRLIRRYTKGDSIAFFSPITFIELMFLYYVIISPIILTASGDTFYGGKNLAPYIPLSWYGAFVSYLSILLGYRIYRSRRTPLQARPHDWEPERIYKIGLILTVAGIVIYVLNGDISLDQLMFQTFAEETSELQDSQLSGYGKQMLNFCIPGCCLMYAAYLKGWKSKSAIIILIALTLASLSCFIIAGFRYRIIYFIITVITFRYIYKKKKPNLLIWSGIFILLIYIMGIIGATRNYHSGLDFEELEDYSESDIITKGMNDTRIFFATGALMDNILTTGDYVYLKPVYTAICMPIPQSIFPGKKPNADYLVDMNNRIWGTADHGIAFMNYGESFYAFGWMGIILNGLLIGLVSGYIMNRFRRNPGSTYNLMILALYNGLTYVILSRGYLAQVVTILFLTIIIPMYITKKFLKA